MALAVLILASRSSLRFRAGGHDHRRRCTDRGRPARSRAVSVPSPLCGDWGDLDDGDRLLNDAALQSGEDRLFSSYQVAPNLKPWIITQWDRSVTTLLLPSEY